MKFTVCSLISMQMRTIEFPVLCHWTGGIAQHTEDRGTSLQPLMDTIGEEIPAPSYDPTEPLQMLVTDLDYSDYLGRLAIGKIAHGTVRINEDLICLNKEGKSMPLRISKLQVYEGVALREVREVVSGDIAILAGIEDVHIGDTICTRSAPKALKRVTVDEPTVSMKFSMNNSPFPEKGKVVQSAKSGAPV